MTIGLVLLAGCKPPPEAPTELSELAGFLFEHFEDEDTRALEEGTYNLWTWLQPNLSATLEGYTVDNLTASVIDSVIPDREHDLENLGGASVAYVSENGVPVLAKTLTMEEQEEVFSNNYAEHDRTFESDKSCFMPKDCDFLDTDNRTLATMPLGIEVRTHSRAQYRWVEFIDDRWAMLHRAWLVEKPEVNQENVIDIHDQLYLGAVMPWDDGSLRLGTTWIAADILGGVVPESTALNMMIDSMQSEGETLDAFIAGEGEE